MSILRTIENRTENWKTVEHFHGISEVAKQRLAKRLCDSEDAHGKDLQVELFWYGMRDYLYSETGPNEQHFPDLARRYENLFHDLRKKVEGFVDQGKFKLKLKDHHYRPSGKSPSGKDGATLLGNNLVGTEIDVVLETPNSLFIGEAKDESDFDAKSPYVLVHQLIRQYVMTKILVERLGSKKKVVPFVVRNEPKGREQAQVQFMVKQGWLPERNILTSDCVNPNPPKEGVGSVS